jgi:hypothetical protein
MTCKRYGWCFKTFVALCTLSQDNPLWREGFLSDFRGEGNKDWWILSKRHLTPKVDWNSFWPARFLCHGNGSPDKTLSICLSQENQEMNPQTHSCKLSKNEMRVVFNNEESLHLWKRHPCTLTVWQQLMDWHKQLTTWRDLCGLLSQQYCVFINPIKLYWIATVSKYFIMVCMTFQSPCIIYAPVLIANKQTHCKCSQHRCIWCFWVW